MAAIILVQYFVPKIVFQIPFFAFNAEEDKFPLIYFPQQ